LDTHAVSTSSRNESSSYRRHRSISPTLQNQRSIIHFSLNDVEPKLPSPPLSFTADTNTFTTTTPTTTSPMDKSTEISINIRDGTISQPIQYPHHSISSDHFNKKRKPNPSEHPNESLIMSGEPHHQSGPNDSWASIQKKIDFSLIDFI